MGTLDHGFEPRTAEAIDGDGGVSIDGRNGARRAGRSNSHPWRTAGRCPRWRDR